MKKMDLFFISESNHRYLFDDFIYPNLACFIPSQITEITQPKSVILHFYVKTLIYLNFILLQTTKRNQKRLT